jgi:adenosine kinase
MAVLICGSMAYDTIMVFEDQFKNHILPDKVHILNVSFLVPELRREFGGCAGNIAYNLKLLGGEPTIMATVGKDFEPYAIWLKNHQIDNTHVMVKEWSYTGQAYITTDKDDNQITAFHPGAMNFSHENKVSDVPGVSLGIVSPDGRQGMIDHATQFAAANIPFIFDPGQGLPMFDGDDLKRFIEQATWLTVNDYESQLLMERTGWSMEKMAAQVQAMVITKGGEGSVIYTEGKEIQIAPVRASKVSDPTGCGDAYRAGILFGLSRGLDWQTTGQVASLMGAIKVEHKGTQNHQFSMSEFKIRYKEAFSVSMP